MAGLNFDITGNNSDFLRKLEETQRGISQTSKKIESEGTSIEGYFNKLAKGAAALGLGFSTAQLIKDIVEVRGQFQQLEIAFETMLKSKEKASALMAQLTDTAARTPFDLQSVAQGAKQLLAYGTASEEVNDTLVRLGNIASGLSIPLGDLVYLYGTTQTQGRLFTQDVRQFMGRGIPLVKELAAELGKSEQQINEMVTAGKIGFPEVEKVIRNMTSENGQFYNLMEKQSQSLTGQISNLGDAWDGMLNKIGTQTQGIASAGISATTSLIENYEEVGVVLASLVVSYGTYKAAIIVINTLERANIMLLRKAVIEKKVAAAANITLSNSMAIAAARGKMFALVQRNIMSSLKGIGSTLANPYVLLGAAVGAATYGLYKFYTRETEVEQMQRRYNDTKEAAVRRESEHKVKVDELINSLEDETTAQMDRVGAIEALKLLYPGIIEKYIDEEGHLRNLIALNKELAEFGATKKVEQNKTDLQSYDERIKNQEEYIDRMRTNDQSAFDDEVAKLEELKRQRELSRANVAADYINKTISEAKSMSDTDIANTINTYQEALSGNKNGEWFDTNQEFKVDEVNRYISALKNLQTTRATAIHDKEYWESLKKETQSQLDALSDVEASGKKGLALKQKITGYENKINKAFSTNTTKQESAAEKLRKEQEKYNLLLDKQSREQKRMEEDSANELKQLEIDRFKEGSEKVLMQRALNHKKELEAIEREAQEKKAKAIEEGRAAHEANPDNKKKSFNAEDFIKSEPVKKQFASFDNVADEKTKTANTQYNRGDDLSGLLNEYQDYTDKRLAIETKFNNDLAVLEEQRKQAIKNGDTQQVEQIDRAKAQATTDKGKSLMGLDYDKLKESPEYVRAFENLKETSSETLNSLLSQLENAKGAAAKVLSPDQLREYTTTIQEIMDELDSRNPFQSLSDKKQELAEAEQELAQAQIELENARHTADAVKGGAKIENGVKSSTLNQKTGKIDSTKAYLTEAQALEKVKTKTNEYNAAKDKTVKASSKVKKSEAEVKEELDELFKAVNDVGNSIGGPAGEIISLIGEIGTFTMAAISGVQAAADTSATAISTVEKASVILAIISAAFQIAMKIASLFNNDEEYQKEIERLQGRIEQLQWELDNSDAIRLQNNSFQALQKVKEVYAETTNEVLKLHSANDKYANGLYKMFGRVIYNNEIMRKSAEKLATAYANIDYTADKALGTQKYSGAKEELKNIAQQQLLIQEQIQNEDDKKKTDHGKIEDWERQIQELGEKANSIINEIVEGIIGGSASDIATELGDAFIEAFQSGENAAEAWGDKVKDIVANVLKRMLVSKYLEEPLGEIFNKYKSKWYKDGEFAGIDAIMESMGGFANDLNTVGSEFQTIWDALPDNIKNMFAPKDESTSQNSTTGGFESMSQDTGNELNGRFTALQISNEEIKNQMITLNQVTASLLGITQVGFNELVNLRIQANSYLEDIAGFQKKMLGLLTDIDSQITRGIKMA